MEYNESTTENLAPIVLSAETLSVLAANVKKLSAITKKVAAFGVKLGIGGVKDDRFIRRRDEILSLFRNNGYKTDNAEIIKFKIDHANVPNRKDTNYATEYTRLYNYSVFMLNKFNPGLGDLFATYFPGFPLSSKGSMMLEPYEGLRLFVESFGVGKYRPGMFPPAAQNTAPLPADLTPAQTPPDVTDTTAAAGFSLPGGNIMSILVIVAIVALFAFTMKK